MLLVHKRQWNGEQSKDLQNYAGRLWLNFLLSTFLIALTLTSDKFQLRLSLPDTWYGSAGARTPTQNSFALRHWCSK